MRVIWAEILFAIFLLPLQVQGQDAAVPDIGLHTAALQGNLEAIQRHIEVGSNLDQRDIYGSTPLIIATIFDRIEVAKTLIEAGANPEIQDNTGSTALQIAAFFSRAEIVKALLENGADPYARNSSGSTAYDIVAVPFDDDKELYDQLGTALEPLGLKLDYERIKQTRPRIRDMLRPDIADLKAVDYTPLPGNGWMVSNPAEQGLDPRLVAEMYLDAAHMENLYGLLVIKNNHLIAERYFNDGAIDRKSLVQSVSKSYISALVGLALENGCLTSLDQKIMEFFPDFKDKIRDPRKFEITIRDMLQMRAGFPWEELDTALWRRFVAGDQFPLFADIPLINDPGEGFNYSNITSYLLGVIVSRACDTDLKTYARKQLLLLIGSGEGDWYPDTNGYYYSFFGFTARDMARLGMLYLNKGIADTNRVLSSDWITESLQPYSNDAWITEDRINTIGRYFKNLDYGYQWWFAKVGDREFNFAWGHGGQLTILLKDLNMVIVVLSDPLYMQHNDEAWGIEQANFNLVGKFINSLSIK